MNGGEYTGSSIAPGLTNGQTGTIEDYIFTQNEHIRITQAPGFTTSDHYLVYYNPHPYDLIVLNESVLKKSGYTFAGWGKSTADTMKLFDKEGKLATYNMGYYSEQVQNNYWNTSTLQSGNITLYALWEPATSYIKFYKNAVDAKFPQPEGWTSAWDEDGSNMAPGRINTDDTQIEIVSQFPVSYVKPTRVGYSFEGWMTQSDYNPSYIVSNGELVSEVTHQSYSIKLYSKDVYPYLDSGKWVAVEGLDEGDPQDLYAAWQANTTTVHFNATEGKFPKPAEWDESLDGLWDEKEGISAFDTKTGDSYISGFDEHPYVEPVRDGYTFEGWAVSYEDRKPVIAKDSRKEDSIRVVLDLTNDYEGNENYKIEGKKWTALEDGAGVTLYAVWEEIPKEQPEEGKPKSEGTKNRIIVVGGLSSEDKTEPGVDYKYITFDANGGDGEMERQQFAPGYTHELHLNEFVKDGFIFTGWALEPTGEIYYEDGQEISITEDITIYAVWTAEETDSGIPLWAIILICVIILIIIAALIYLFVIRQR